jgi:DNA-binding NtrC family response regulator
MIFDEIARAAERTAILSALTINGWRLRPTATALSITPGRLRRLILECGLEEEYLENNPGAGRPSYVGSERTTRWV